MKWKPFQISQWLETNQNDIRVGLSSPTDKVNVYQTQIPAFGRVVGLPVGIKHLIVGYVITDKEYEQGGAELDTDGYWRIDAINLGGLKHRLYFKIFDETDRVIAVSKEITIFKRSGTPSLAGHSFHCFHPLICSHSSLSSVFPCGRFSFCSHNHFTL